MTEDPETIEHQVHLPNYLESLSKIDQDNLRAITAGFEEVLRRKGLNGVLKAVGGTIDKPLPRKDIDLTLRLVEQETDQKAEDFLDYLEYSKARFNILRDLVEEIVARKPELGIEEIIEPTINEEFESPSILKNDGTIKIKPKRGTPIEIIRIPETSETVERRPFVLLTEAQKAA